MASYSHSTKPELIVKHTTLFNIKDKTIQIVEFFNAKKEHFTFIQLTKELYRPFALNLSWSIINVV